MEIGAAFVLVIVIISMALIATASIKQRNQNKREQELRTYVVGKVSDAIKQHGRVLHRKRHQLIQVDDYGIVDRSRWENEKNYFLDNVLFKDEPSSTGGIDVAALLDELLDRQQAEPLTVAPSDPIHFEAFCSDLLRRNGWTTRLTKASGDQGADIVAELGDTVAVLQCKLYSTPVGNKAVQEVVAAKALHGARHAIVVSNYLYTNSARELAKANGVHLLHYDDLKSLAATLGLRSPEPRIEGGQVLLKTSLAKPASASSLQKPDGRDNNFLLTLIPICVILTVFAVGLYSNSTGTHPIPSGDYEEYLKWARIQHAKQDQSRTATRPPCESLIREATKEFAISILSEEKTRDSYRAHLTEPVVGTLSIDCKSPDWLPNIKFSISTAPSEATVEVINELGRKLVGPNVKMLTQQTLNCLNASDTAKTCSTTTASDGAEVNIEFNK